MKRWLTMFAAASLLVGCVARQSAPQADGACSVRSLRASGSVSPSGKHGAEPLAFALQRVAVSHLLNLEGGHGAAIWLPPTPSEEGLILTARHVLPRHDNRVEVDGTWVTFEQTAAGKDPDNHRTWSDDWAVARLPADLRPNGPPLRLASCEPRTDTPVYLLGFWEGAAPDRSPDAVRSLPLQILPTRVVPRPDPTRDGLNPPPEEFICVELPRDIDHVRGFSGGPAVAWDETRRELVLVGIVVRHWQWVDAQGQVVSQVVLVRRVSDLGLLGS